MKRRGILTLALALMLAMVLSLSAFAAETAEVYEKWDYIDGVINPVDDKYILNEYGSYNDFPSMYMYDFIGEDYLKSVSVSNTDDFYVEADGSMVPLPEDNSMIEFCIGIELKHDIDACTPGEVYETDVMLTLENGKSTTFKYVFEITDEPAFSMPEFYYNGLSVDDDKLEAGKTYEVRTELVDKKGFLKGEDYTINLEIFRDGDENYAEILNGVYSESNPLTFKVLKIGTFELVFSVIIDGEHVISHGFEYSSNKQAEEIENKVTNETIENAVDSVVDGVVNLPMTDNEVLTADSLAYLKEQAAMQGDVDKVVLQPDEAGVTLSFDPAEIDTTKLGNKQFTASVRTTCPDEIEKITGLTDNKGGSWVDFNFSGELPAPMTITVKIDPNDYPAGITADGFKIWYFNDETGSMEAQDIPVTYDAAAKTVTFTLEHFSAYLILDSASNPEITVSLVGPTGSNNGGIALEGPYKYYSDDNIMKNMREDAIEGGGTFEYGGDVYYLIIDEKAGSVPLNNRYFVEKLKAKADWSMNGDLVTGMEIVKVEVDADATLNNGNRYECGSIVDKSGYWYFVKLSLADKTTTSETDVSGQIEFDRSANSKKGVEKVKDAIVDVDFSVFYDENWELIGKVVDETIDIEWDTNYVLKFDSDDEVELNFGCPHGGNNEGVFTVDASGQSKLLLNYSTDPVEAIADANPGAAMDFLSFSGIGGKAVRFNRSGEFVYEMEDGAYAYRVVDGKLVEMPGCYDESEDAFVFKTNTLESYVFADRALVNP